MKIYICNALALSMLDRGSQRYQPNAVAQGRTWPGPRIPVPVDDPVAWLAERQPAELVSAVGHPDTAAAFTLVLGIPVRENRVNIQLPPLTHRHDTETRALIGQYIGPRLPTGATELPEGTRIEWWTV